jgi:hypothetical protein
LNYRKRIYGLLIALMCLPFLLTAQSIFEQIGKIPLTAYSPDEYGGAPMVWSILQSKDGLMYFGNSSGIAEYDGVSWHMLFKTNQSISTYSLTKDDKAQIFYAGRDFSYFEAGKYLLIGGQTTGFYVFDGMPPIKLPTGIDRDLENGILLHDAIPYQGNYIVALLGRGVVVMNHKGKILKKIGIEQGLSTNVVSQVYLGQNKGLWATRDDVIAKIAIASPNLTYGNELEIKSAVWKIHKNGKEPRSGLGLSLSYDIVKAHGGEISVEPQEGLGNRFNISLPI